MTRMRTLRVAVVVALTALPTAGCGTESKDTAAQSPGALTPAAQAADDATATAPTPSDSPSDSTSAETVYSSKALPDVRNVNLSWRGNMIGSAHLDGGKAVFRGWLPGMATIAECTPSLWAANERPSNDTVVKADVDMIATSSDNPVVAIAYAVKTNASGLDPESTRIYVSTLDLNTCAVGARIDVLGAPVPRENFATAPKLVASGPTTVAVAPWPGIETKLPDLPAFVGINPTSGAASWSKSLPGKQAEAGNRYTGGPVADGVFDLSSRISGQVGERVLIDAETGSELVKADDFEAPAARLGADRMVYTTTEKNPNAQSMLSGGKVSVLSGGALKEGAVVMDDGNGQSVLIGRYCPSDDGCSVIASDGGLAYIGASNAVTPVMDQAKTEDLGLKFRGGSAGKLYVQTTQEHLTIGLDGKQIGSAYDHAQYPYAPVGEKRIAGTLWTLWKSDGGFAGNDDFAIGKNGQPPRAQ